MDGSLLIVLAFFVVVACGIAFGIKTLLYAARCSAKLSDEVRKVSPEAFQAIWSYRPFNSSHDRLNAFLKTTDLEEVEAIFTAKQCCREAQKRFRNTFLLYIFSILGIAILVILVLLIQANQ